MCEILSSAAQQPNKLVREYIFVRENFQKIWFPLHACHKFTHYLLTSNLETARAVLPCPAHAALQGHEESMQFLEGVRDVMEIAISERVESLNHVASK